MFHNDSNLFTIPYNIKNQQSTLNQTDENMNQSLHYSNLECSMSKQERAFFGIYCPTHNEEGIYKCSICRGLRQVCHTNKPKQDNYIKEQMIGNSNFNSQNATFGKALRQNKMIFHHAFESKNQSTSLQDQRSNLKGDNFEKPVIKSTGNMKGTHQIIQQIHYIPIFHTMIVPEIINPENQFNPKKQNQNNNLKTSFCSFTPSKIKQHHSNRSEEVMTPQNLRKLAESILR